MNAQLIDEADRLCDKLLEMREEWRRWPVMHTRLVKLSKMAGRRLARRRQMADVLPGDTDLDTWQQTDWLISRLGENRTLNAKERRNLELLLRRYRKRHHRNAHVRPQSPRHAGQLD